MPGLFTRALRKMRHTCGAHMAPAAGALRRLRKRSVTILMYHGVTEKQLVCPDWCQVGLQNFQQQMEFLNQEYWVLSLGEVVQRLADGKPLPERTACLTFDDGFRNVYTSAWPVLSRHQLPSTVFLVTSLPETGLPPWPGLILHALSTTALTSIRFEGRDWQLSNGQRGDASDWIVDRLKVLPQQERDRSVGKLITELGGGKEIDFSGCPRATMNWDEIYKLARASGGLMRFESHSHTHASLSNCCIAEQQQELKTSRDILRERLPVEDLFCYPFGDFAPSTVKILRELGYRCGLTTGYGLIRRTSDPYTLRRVGIGPAVTAREFEMAMVGCFQ
jgi:peptidoglycan/xylan/chitin deacetylase (PgdA/CDA1 family)